MSFTTAVDHLLGLFQVEAQPVIGGVRFLFSLIMFLVLASLEKIADNGRLDFRCHPEINHALMQECLSRFPEERSFIDPYFFVRITAGTLFVLWSAINLYSSKHHGEIWVFFQPHMLLNMRFLSCFLVRTSSQVKSSQQNS